MQVIGRLLRHSLVYAVANGLQRVTGFLLIPLYTRVLNVESYGTLEILTTLGNSGFILASLGLPSAANKCYHRDCAGEEDRKALAGTMLWLLAPAALATAVVGFLLARPLSHALLGEESDAGLVALSLASTAGFALAQLPLTLLRARESSLAYSLLSFWQFLSMLGLNLWLVGHEGLGIKGVLLGSIGASVVVLLSSIPF